MCDDRGGASHPGADDAVDDQFYEFRRTASKRSERARGGADQHENGKMVSTPHKKRTGERTTIIICLCVLCTGMYNTKAQMHVNPWWAALTVWGVVNAVNVLQTAGFISRVITGTHKINHFLGYGIIALGVPAILAIVGFVRVQASWWQWIGPAVFLAFLACMIVVEYGWRVEFRSPMRYGILVPYLVLFFLFQTLLSNLQAYYRETIPIYTHSATPITNTASYTLERLLEARYPVS